MCKHFWRVLGKQGGRWFKGHALIACRHCGAVSVAGWGEGIGPCSHVVPRVEEQAAPIVYSKMEQYDTCPSCGAERMGEEECEWCGET